MVVTRPRPEGIQQKNQGPGNPGSRYLVGH